MWKDAIEIFDEFLVPREHKERDQKQKKRDAFSNEQRQAFEKQLSDFLDTVPVNSQRTAYNKIIRIPGFDKKIT